MGANWHGMSAADLGRGIEAGRIDPVELAEHFLDRIADHPMASRIYARTTPDRALAEARAAADRAGADLRLTPLDGVPLSWKDLFDTAGTRTEAGSALLKGRVPKTDAEVLQAATLGGSVCLGKTHMSELAFSGLGLNPVTETPPCVNDPAAVSGGSSSGAAASVAFGLAPAAIGSDTGGSVRIPSAWNDLVGLKATHGRLSVAGTVPLAGTFDTVGALCRSVEDAALLLGLLEGRRGADLTGATLAGVRLMVLDTIALDDLCDGSAKGFEEAVQRLGDAGAEIVHAGVPELRDAMSLSGVLYTTSAYAEWKDVIEAAPHLMHHEILKRFRLGAKFSGTDYIQAWDRLHKVRAAYLERTAGHDAVILPTCPNLPPEKSRLEADHDHYVAQNLLALRNTRIGNLMGLTALTLPTSVKSAGITLQSAPGSEERLLRLGHAAHRALA